MNILGLIFTFIFNHLGNLNSTETQICWYQDGDVTSKQQAAKEVKGDSGESCMILDLDMSGECLGAASGGIRSLSHVTKRGYMAG